MGRFLSDKKRRADLIVIASLLLLALALYLVLGATRREGGVVVVRVDGAETERHALSEDGTYPLNGGSNILVIAKGQAWLSDANCPDLLCVRQGRRGRRWAHPFPAYPPSPGVPVPGRS